MDIINDYSKRYPDDKVFLMGGSAAYLWIKDKLGKELPAPYVDIHVNTKAALNTIGERWCKLLPNHTLAQPLGDGAFGFAKFKNTDTGELEFVVTINYRMSSAETAIVDGYRVQGLGWCFKDSRCDMNDVKDRIKTVCSDTTKLRQQFKMLQDRCILLKKALEKQ